MPNSVSFRLFALLTLFVFLSACGSGPVESDPSGDDVGVDRDVGNDSDADIDAEEDGDTDNGEDVSDDEDVAENNGEGIYSPVTNQGAPSEIADYAELRETGADGFLLRGTVLTPDGIIEDGEVLVDGELIVCVDVDCSNEAQNGSYNVIETGGVISPGLIDAHNHLPYNFLQPWFPSPMTLFDNRYAWADDDDYRTHIAPYGDNRSTGVYYCPAAKWGELRSLINGTTTVQGQSFQQLCVNWAVRNADHYHGLQHNHMRTSIGSVNTFDEDDAQNYIASFERDSNPTTRLAIHMTEGHSGRGIEDEFEHFADLALLEHGAAMLIHAMALNVAQLEMVYLTESRIVWSPSSNFHLYGHGVTAPIEDILEMDVKVALGPDWTISGAFDMLAELRIAQEFGDLEGIDLLTPERLWEMATAGGAEAVGLHEFVGRLEPGYHADIAVFGRNGEDPYQAVIDSYTEDMELVLIGGEAYYGDFHMEQAARNEHCDEFDACGRAKFLCAQDSPGAGNRRDERVDDIRDQLITILDGFEDAPEDEQYGRGDELLELAICGT